MPADESRIGNPLAIVVNVRQLALWCSSKAGVVDPISKAGHFQQHLSLGNERTGIRETEGRHKCVERDHPALLESGCEGAWHAGRARCECWSISIKQRATQAQGTHV